MSENHPKVRLVHTELIDVVRETATPLRKADEAAALLRGLIGGRDRECFAVLHLDACNRVITGEIVSVGHLTAALVHPREVYKAAILQNAAAIICGHNHPSGDLQPSAEDTAIFERLSAAGQILGVELIDFLVITGEGHLAYSEHPPKTP